MFVARSQGLTWGILTFNFIGMKKIPGCARLVAFACCLMSGCAASKQAIHQERTVFPKRFLLDKERDLKETTSGNSFVTTLPGVHPVFGEALTIRVRGLRAESIKQDDPRKAALAFDQWLKFKRVMEDARTVELRNLERGEGGFWVLADLYLDGRLIQ